MASVSAGVNSLVAIQLALAGSMGLMQVHDGYRRIRD